MPKATTSIKIDKATLDSLKAIAHPGQSLNGVIQELLQKQGQNEIRKEVS